MSISAINKNTPPTDTKAKSAISLFFIDSPFYVFDTVPVLLYGCLFEKLLLELLVALLLFVTLQHMAHPIHLDRSRKVRKQVLLRVCRVYATLKQTVERIRLCVFNILLASSFEAWKAREDPRVHLHKHLGKLVGAGVRLLALYYRFLQLSRVNVVDCRLSAFSSVHCPSPCSCFGS